MLFEVVDDGGISLHAVSFGSRCRDAATTGRGEHAGGVAEVPFSTYECHALQMFQRDSFEPRKLHWQRHHLVWRGGVSAANAPSPRRRSQGPSPF